MKTNSLYIASRERHAGSLIISLGLMAMLRQRHEHIAYFIPIYESKHSEDFEYINKTFQLNLVQQEMFGVSLAEATQSVSENKTHELYEKLIQHYQKLAQEYDFVLIQGMELSRAASVIDFDINLTLAKNFNSTFVSVINGMNKTKDEIFQEIEIERHTHHSLDPFAFFINRVPLELAEQTRSTSNLPIFFIPELEALNLPTVIEVAKALSGEILTKKKVGWNRLVQEPIVAAMTPEHYLPRVKQGDLVIVPGDRTDILLASAMSMLDRRLPIISGVILTGGLKPAPVIQNLIFDFNENALPIISVETDTYETAMLASQVEAKFHVENKQKTNMALGLFDKWVDRQCLLEKLQQHSDTHHIMTPTMFEFSLFEKARTERQTIVLPESDDERVLRACEVLHNRQVVKPVLLGNAEEIHYRSSLLGINLEGVDIIDPEQSQWKEEFIETFYEMRKHKGLTRDVARDSMTHVNYFATMMVQTGKADGMVSGANHTTADTVRPALQIIKTQPEIRTVSSVFFMCFDTRVLVYGDCAVNQKPTSEQLAEIAVTSADTAKQFGIEPKVALLSYSTGSSGHGDEVDKVIQATEKAKQLRPDLLLEGPIQYDAAIDADVGRQKLPNSQVAGQATVFIFPDLNTGNNTYKAVQRASDAIAIGPVLQGLKKPVNDLSRGCSVTDIVNTVAITAIQAHQQ